MKRILQIISILGLILTLAPGILVFTGSLEFEAYKRWVLIGTLLWFSTAPFWVNKEKKNA